MPFMKMNNVAKFGAGALGAFALTFGAAGVAGAQDDAPTNEEPTESVEQDFRSKRSEARQVKKAALADLVGLSVDELSEARKSGQSLAEIAGDDVDAVAEFLTNNAEEWIAAKVEAGRLTEEQAAERLDDIDEKVAERLSNTEGRDRGGRKGFRGERGNARGERGQQAATVNS